MSVYPGHPMDLGAVLVGLVGGGAPSIFHLLLSANRSQPPHVVSVVECSEKHPQSLTFPLIPCGDSIGHCVTPAFPCLQGWISCVFLLDGQELQPDALLGPELKGCKEG